METLTELLEEQLFAPLRSCRIYRIEEGKEVLKEKGRNPVIDMALIGAAQRVEHYEISAYGTARTLAEHLGHEEVQKLLQETLDEESSADQRLTEVSLSEVLPEAATGTDEEKPQRAPNRSRRN